MKTLTDFIQERKRELVAARADALRALEDIEAELKQLEQASRAVAPANIGGSVTDTGAGAVTSRQRRSPSPPVPGTIKYMALEIIKTKPAGINAQEILLRLNDRGDQKYARSSLSPQLSRLKKAGLIEDSNGRWMYIGPSST